uniref:Secreted protein n=1 Tax=Heterorhabditis bacteriophora TaxID=37862 RepID=A0A1I7W6L8_HETBA
MAIVFFTNFIRLLLVSLHDMQSPASNSQLQSPSVTCFSSRKQVGRLRKCFAELFNFIISKIKRITQAFAGQVNTHKIILISSCKIAYSLLQASISTFNTFCLYMKLFSGVFVIFLEIYNLNVYYIYTFIYVVLLRELYQHTFAVFGDVYKLVIILNFTIEELRFANFNYMGY